MRRERGRVSVPRSYRVVRTERVSLTSALSRTGQVLVVRRELSRILGLLLLACGRRLSLGFVLGSVFRGFPLLRLCLRRCGDALPIGVSFFFAFLPVLSAKRLDTLRSPERLAVFRSVLVVSRNRVGRECSGLGEPDEAYGVALRRHLDSRGESDAPVHESPGASSRRFLTVLRSDRDDPPPGDRSEAGRSPRRLPSARWRCRRIRRAGQRRR